ncbi:hypothetical protein [Halorussus marinus]|uniref:hypothetical protein n=1 Tax=Halorussus marinus TaxID=2505976 RepID=UPI00106E4249|nr:hypothetical protein [Halorussus marinus]
MDLVFRGDTITKPSNVTLGLFHDGEVSGDTTNGDDLNDSSDIGDITTEPSGSAYARQSASFDTTDFTVLYESGNWQAEIATQDFDVSDSDQEVDAYFVLVEFQADTTSDGSPTDHLFWTDTLDKAYNLSNISDTAKLADGSLIIT